MSQKTDLQQKWAVASYALQDAYTDFILSRQAMLCSPKTIRFYHFTAGRFVKYLEDNGVIGPEGVSSRYIRAYLAELAAQNLSDSYINGHARAIKTLVKFWHKEKFIEEIPTFKMPAIAKKRLPVLTAPQVKKVLGECNNNRDKAIIMLLVDTGLRRAEICALNWGDIDISSGIVRVVKGKGGKARSVVTGIKTRRALLAYRRDIEHDDEHPVFQTCSGSRLTANGLRSALLRVGKRAGIHITPHALRRTFATLSLRAGMNLIQLQAMMGHSSLEMTSKYIQMLDEDLVEAHKAHGPIDTFY
ncbi:tyrosine-type recombinase/integrase [Patescibacteria group bacterium]|nr:tyrosine-type recombinase/integrase [Patescibacteria group bacterium]